MDDNMDDHMDIPTRELTVWTTRYGLSWFMCKQPMMVSVRVTSLLYASC